jgi:hypothetical protein
MSALNVIRQRDRVVLVTDGAVYDTSTGVVQGFPAKQITLPSLPAVLATRGAPLATPVYGHLLGCRFQSFDELIASIENELPGVHARIKFLCRGNVNEPIFIAWWSPQLAARQLNCESVFRGVLGYGRGRNNARAGSVAPRGSAQPGASRLASQRSTRPKPTGGTWGKL